MLCPTRGLLQVPLGKNERVVILQSLNGVAGCIANACELVIQ